MTRCDAGRACVALALLAVVAQPFRAGGGETGLGVVEFPTSGSPEAQPHFVRGVAALHNFEYEEAVAAFRRARAVDRGFALAYWGEALAHDAVLQPSPDLAAGRAVLRQLAPTREARLARAPTAREKGLLDAVEQLFAAGDGPARRRDYGAAMARLHERFPADIEVASFYALALLDTAIRQTYGLDDVSEAHHADTPSTPGRLMLAGSDTQIRVGAILRTVLARNPNHPGAAHYLLHTYDDAEHAPLALDVARTYARIAPASPHARHMPAHIFLQLGLWREAAASDEAASAAADARTPDESKRDHHPMTWLQYELLQMGQYGRAKQLVERMAASAARTGAAVLKSHAASMRGRYVVETGRWELLRDGDDFGNLDELVAIGISAARAGNGDRAGQVRELLARLARAERSRTFKPALIVMERQVAGLLHAAAGRRHEAVAALREAADAESRLPTGMGPPRPIKPAQELLGEVLLELGEAAEARTAFEAALERFPNRSASVLGLARAAATIGDRPAAVRQYRALLANWSDADRDLADVTEAGEAVDRPVQRTALDRRVGLGALGALALVAGAVFLWRRSRRRRSAARRRRR